jgi:hypothetical protein
MRKLRRYYFSGIVSLQKQRQVKEVYKWLEDEEEDVSNYWMILKETRGY